MPPRTKKLPAKQFLSAKQKAPGGLKGKTFSGPHTATAKTASMKWKKKFPISKTTSAVKPTNFTKSTRTGGPYQNKGRPLVVKPPPKKRKK